MSLNLHEGTASRTSSSLLQAARNHDAEAWRRIVDLYSRRIYRWCRLARLQPEDASDVAQEVFRAVARKLVDFHHHNRGDSFRGWLYTITQNKIRDYVRRGPRRHEMVCGGTNAQRRFLDLPDEASESSDTEGRLVSTRIDPQVLERVRSELSERDWLVFWRVVVDGQTSREAGELFDMSSNAVRLVKMRVLRRFRELLTPAQPMHSRHRQNDADL